MTDETAAHSPIGASGYYRWKKCPGSVALSKDAANLSSEFADEGTAAHNLAEEILVARRDGTPEPDLFMYDDDFIDPILIYVDHMESLQVGNYIQKFEHRFHLKEIHPLCFGTADGVTFYPDEQLLVISDYKHGAGLFVEIEENDQLNYYAVGAVLSLGFPVKTIRIEIIQPRITYAEAIRPWETDIFDLWDFADQLKQDALATEDPNAPLSAGDWCAFCPAAPKCPLLRLKAKIEMQKIEMGVVETLETIAQELEWIPILEAAFRRKREYAYAMAEKGEDVPGYKLVEKRGKRAWKDEEDAGGDLRLVGLTYDQLFKPPKPAEMKSPAQIEALKVGEIPFATKKALKEFVEDRVENKSSGHKLVPIDHDGEAIKPVTAKSVFSPTEEPDVLS